MLATKTPDLQEALDQEWETIPTGLGIAYDAEADGPLTGNYIGVVTKEIEDRMQPVHQFAPVNDPDAIYFIWGGYELDEALSKVKQGTLVRVTFTGRSQFKSKEGPRQIKHYKVQIAKSAN